MATDPREPQAEGLAPTKKHEGLFRCKGCGGIVCRDSRSRKMTPMGNGHDCEQWRVLVQAWQEEAE
jgi:hypothetical protein